MGTVARSAYRLAMVQIDFGFFSLESTENLGNVVIKKSIWEHHLGFSDTGLFIDVHFYWLDKACKKKVIIKNA